MSSMIVGMLSEIRDAGTVQTDGEVLELLFTKLDRNRRGSIVLLANSSYPFNRNFLFME